MDRSTANTTSSAPRAGLSGAVCGAQNHLDAESVSWLQNTLAAFPGTVVAVTHDRYFLDSVAGWILELDQGKGVPLLPPLPLSKGMPARHLPERPNTRALTEHKTLSLQ